MNRPPGGAADEIVQRDVDGRLGAAVAVERRIHRRRGAGKIDGVARQQAGRQMRHRRHHAGDGFPGHDRRRSRLAPADDAVLGLDANEHVVGARDGLAGHLHRLFHRQADRDGLDCFDPHGAPRSRCRYDFTGRGVIAFAFTSSFRRYVGLCQIHRRGHFAVD